MLLGYFFIEFEENHCQLDIATIYIATRYMLREHVVVTKLSTKHLEDDRNNDPK